MKDNHYLILSIFCFYNSNRKCGNSRSCIVNFNNLTKTQKESVQVAELTPGKNGERALLVYMSMIKMFVN